MNKKIIVCAFGPVGFGNLNQLLMMPQCSADDIFVYTENKDSNKMLIEFLENMKISYSFELINNCFDEVKSMKPDYIISMFYRRIIDEKILKIVGDRTLNVHQSLLPRHKGRFIAFWTLFSNDKFTGVTYHRMIKEVDSGEILLVKKIKIDKDETAYSLHNKLIHLAISNFQLAFKRLINGYSGYQIKGKSTETSYFGSKIPFDGILNANKTSYDKAIDFVSAMYFPPMSGAKFIINKKIIEINSIKELSKYRKKFKIGVGLYG